MVGWHHQLRGQECEQIPVDKRGVLQSMGSQRVAHDLATEQQQILMYHKLQSRLPGEISTTSVMQRIPF